MWATMKYVSLTWIVKGIIASITPEIPPRVNIVKKPRAKSMGVSRRSTPFHSVASQEKILIPVDAAMNGVAMTTSSDVEKFAHTSNGMRKKLMPGARIVMIVTRKFSAVAIDDAPANCTPMVKKTCPIGEVVDSGAYAVQPVENE